MSGVQGVQAIGQVNRSRLARAIRGAIERRPVHVKPVRGGRTQAERSLQQRNLELATLNSVAEALGSTLQLDKLLERVLDELQRVVPYDAASINLLRDGSCWAAASRGRENPQSKGFKLEERPLVQRVVRERSLLIVSDVRGEPDWIPIRGTESVRSWLGVPLVSKGRVIGVLMIDSHRPGTYSAGVTDLVSAFAHQVALAIDNARLYERTRAQLQEAILLHGVTAALASTGHLIVRDREPF